jgi:hypothetical protein
MIQMEIYKINFFMFLNCFYVMVLKINFKNIILMYL